MKRFNNKGMMVIPEPISSDSIKEGKVLIITEAYCPNGHNLIDKRAMFNGHPGIITNIDENGDTGTMALSPVVGDKARICLDVDLSDGEHIDIFCPHCDVQLPIHSPCDMCDGHLVALFLTPEANFNDCVGVCDQIGCPNAKILSSGEIIAISHVNFSNR